MTRWKIITEVAVGIIAIGVFLFSIGVFHHSPTSHLLSATIVGSKNNTVNIPGTSIDATPIPKEDWVKYENIEVQSASGQSIHVNAEEHPVMFFAYWCPHCHRQLTAMAQANLIDKATLVSIWPEDAASQFHADTEKALNDVGIRGYTVEYQSDSDIVKPFVKTIPTTVFMYEGTLYSVTGEIDSVSDLQKIFGSQQ